MAWERATRGVDDSGRRSTLDRVDGGVVATGAQAKKQRESGGWRRRGDCGTRWRSRVRDEGRSELRDPQALRVVIIINLSGV